MDSGKDTASSVSLPEGDLQAILALARRQAGSPPVPWLLPRKAIVERGAQRWKVRFYPTEAEAALQETYLALAGPAARMPSLVARRGECLVFEWPELDPPSGSDPHLMEGIGEFLGSLSGIACPGASSQALMDEVACWLDRLEDVRLISVRARRWIWRRLSGLGHEHARVSLEYLDAMPHNFGSMAGELVMLDEKHLRPSFTGAGLVKPRCILPAASYRSLREAYDRRVGNAELGDPEAFLEIYYFIHALHFYAQRMGEGAAHLPAVARCRRYRRWLVSRAAPSRVADLVENLRFIAAYPVDAWRFAMSKARYFLSGSARIADEPLSTSP
jgi:hypothetical protein